MLEMKEILTRLEEMEQRLNKMEGGAQEQKQEKFKKPQLIRKICKVSNQLLIKIIVKINKSF